MDFLVINKMLKSLQEIKKKETVNKRKQSKKIERKINYRFVFNITFVVTHFLKISKFSIFKNLFTNSAFIK